MTVYINPPPREFMCECCSSKDDQVAPSPITGKPIIFKTWQSHGRFHNVSAVWVCPFCAGLPPRLFWKIYHMSRALSLGQWMADNKIQWVMFNTWRESTIRKYLRRYFKSIEELQGEQHK